MKRTIVTAGQEGFAGLLGGDVRLEEALARLNQGGWRHGAETLSGAESTQETAHGSGGEVVVLPKAALRRTIDDTGGMASPAAATDQPPTSASPPLPPTRPFAAGPAFAARFGHCRQALGGRKPSIAASGHAGGRSRRPA
jgi:hypothetical protein